MEAKGVKCFNSFKSISKKMKILRKMSFMLNILPSQWYGEWKNNLNDADTVIIFASNRWDFIKYICKNYPALRVIVWYWNPIDKCFTPNVLKSKNLEYWSFDIKDCEKYQLKHNSTFYFDNIQKYNHGNDVGVLFVGADKGRKTFLDKIEKQFDERNIKSAFHIVPDRGAVNLGNIKPIDYEEYLKRVSRCSALLDFLQKGQNGQTLRPMEAIFFQKKLITNDKTIVSLNFYDSRNIFIIGKDDINALREFIESPYEKISEKIVQQYDFSSWLKRFEL